MSNDDKSDSENKSGKAVSSGTAASSGAASKGSNWREPQTIEAKAVASTVHEPAPPAAGTPPKPAQPEKPVAAAASTKATATTPVTAAAPVKPASSGAASSGASGASTASAASAKAKPDAPEPAKAAGGRRSGVAFAVLAGAGVALLGSIALHMIHDPEAEIGTLQTSLRNQAHDFSDFKTQSQSAIAALQKQVAALQAAPMAPAPSAAGQALIQAEPGPASNVSSGAIANLQSRIDKVDQALPPIVADLAAQKTQIAKIATTPNAAALAEIAQSTLRAIDQSRPFPTELKALQELHVPAEQLTPLAKIAEKGAPDARELAKSFAPIMEKIAAASAPPPPAAHDMMGWLASKAASLVQVRPVGVQAGHSPTAVASQVEAALQAGQADQALSLWQSLPPAMQSLGSDWASGLDARQAAQAAATKILNGAIAAMATPDTSAGDAKP